MITSLIISISAASVSHTWISTGVNVTKQQKMSTLLPPKPTPLVPDQTIAKACFDLVGYTEKTRERIKTKGEDFLVSASLRTSQLHPSKHGTTGGKRMRHKSHRQEDNENLMKQSRKTSCCSRKKLTMLFSMVWMLSCHSVGFLDDRHCFKSWRTMSY